jgi:hypothetical protein
MIRASALVVALLGYPVAQVFVSAEAKKPSAADFDSSAWQTAE